MKTKYVLLISCISATLTLCFSSCENDFDAKIYGSLSTTNFPATEDDYIDLLMTCYLPFTANWGYDLGTWQHSFYVPEGGIMRLLDTPTDLGARAITRSTQSAWAYIPNCNFEDLKLVGRGTGEAPSNFEKVRDISRFTEIIDMLEKSEILSETRKNELLGEARLCRGLMLYYMLHYFGPVPVIIDPSLVGNLEEEKKLERPTLNEFVSYITADLEFAVSNIPEKQFEVGRYHRNYARFCLMRHYLNEGSYIKGFYPKAYDLFDQFTTVYHLFTDGATPYADQFKQRIQQRSHRGAFMLLRRRRKAWQLQPCSVLLHTYGRSQSR
jgi:hypothetical protein